MQIKKTLYLILTACLSFILFSCSSEKNEPKLTSNITDEVKKAGIELISENCSGCHIASKQGSFSRISAIRKTPEGWDMNIVRMMIFHGVEIEKSDRRKLVKYLSDTQGLAPSETAGFRDILERKHNVIEPTEDQDLMNMCARCHTYTRVALQRRDVNEWQNLVHMHLGQWASIEYHMLARERDWRADALGSVSEKLAKKYPFETEAWNEWQKTPWKDMSGEWRIIGHIAGTGDIEGTMSISKAQGNDQYKTSFTLNFPKGEKVTGGGKALVYSGYEWRGTAKLNDVKYRQIWAASSDGNSMKGRFFKKSNPEEGIEITALRKQDTVHTIMSVTPSSLATRTETEITINGINLSGDVHIEGTKITVKSQTPDRIVILATAESTPDQSSKVTIGKSTYDKAFPIYKAVDYIKITPEYGISRVGGGGGATAKVKAQFEAIGYLNGKDGVKGTKDDIRLGMVFVTWSHENFNEDAAKMQDKKYAGILTKRGTFIPAIAGPNPVRKYGTNNVGDLRIIAVYEKNGVKLTAEAHLIATVQRWNNPPIP